MGYKTGTSSIVKITNLDDKNQVKGVYKRSRTITMLGEEIQVYAKDPSVQGRLWGRSFSSGQIGYTDDDCETFVAKAPSIDTVRIKTITFSDNYMWVLTSSTQAQQGRLWRSPLPNANGEGIQWTKVFDLATFPGGDNAVFRNSCVAVKEPYVYLVEYSSLPITGGASIYCSSNNGNSFSKTKTFENAKHIHAIQIINDLPWVMIGDAGFSDLGLWQATNLAASNWVRKSIYGNEMGGNYHYGINFFKMSIDGQDVIVSETDTKHGHGPLLYPRINTNNFPLVPLGHMHPPYLGTMRALTLTKEGNLMWVSVGEGGAITGLDSIWIAKKPYYNPILLESFPLNELGVLEDPLENGDYIYFGNHRITKEKFIGQ